MDQEDVEVKAKRKKSKHSLETIQEEHVKNKRKSKKDKKSKQREETEVDKQISVGNKTEDGETDEYASDRPVQVSVVTNKKDSIVGTSNDKDDTINWPEHDLSELFKRIEVCLPEKDTLSYSTRAEKLCWDNVSNLTSHSALFKNLCVCVGIECGVACLIYFNYMYFRSVVLNLDGIRYYCSKRSNYSM